MSDAEKLVEFSLNLSLRDIPPQVIKAAKHRIMDILGVGIAACGTPVVESLRRVLKEMGGNQESSLLGYGNKMTASQAAFVNATLGHTLDFDDTHTGSVVHPTACIIPTALAMAEKLGLDGNAVLTAAIAGWEAMTRIGLGSRGRFNQIGFHSTAICGAFATTLVSSKLIGLDKNKTLNALGIVGSFTSGILEFLSDGSSVKRIHPGWASQSGIMASQLAREGMTGPHTIFEGRFGLYNTHLGKDEGVPEWLSKDLGTSWKTLEISYKPYPCCQYLIAFIDCMRALKGRHGIKPEEIDTIDCYISEGQVPFVCEPVEAKKRPRTEYEAKFSLPYVCGVVLLYGYCDTKDFTKESIKNKEVLSIANKVSYHIDPNSKFPAAFPGHIKIRMKNGTVFEEKEDNNKGSAENPLTDEEIMGKFSSNLEKYFSEKEIVNISETILNLESLRDICKLFNSLKINKLSITFP